METLSLLSGPFVFLDTALPFIMFLIAAVILTGNFAVKTVFDRCGLGLYPRYLTGAVVGALALALSTSFELIATQTLIVLLVGLAVMAVRGGSRQIAVANLVVAAILIPVAIIP